MAFEKETIESLHKKLETKECSAREVAEDFLKHIEEKDKDIHAFLHVRKEEALHEADVVDKKIQNGEEVSMLAGIPIALKDNMIAKGEQATAGSKILESYRGSYDGTVVRKLKDAGAVIVGRTNLDEFAMGSSTENSAYGVTKNPHDTTKVPGGSSGGSAAAVAAGFALGSLGSDTGGSIRQPAAFCGTVGLKPTYGAVSRFGLIAMASSLDQIGPFTKTVRDARIVFNAIKGKDGRDATTSFDYTVEPLSESETKKLVIGVPKEFFISGISKEVEDAVRGVAEKLKGQQIEFKEISLPHTKYALSCYYIIMPAEVSSNLARFEGIRYGRVVKDAENLKELYFKNRGLGFGKETRRRILLGTFVLSSGYYDAYYTKAQKVRRLVAQDFEEAFKEVDVILGPTTPTTAFGFGEKTKDPVSMYLSDIFTISANLAGVPAMSVPVKKYEVGSGELPIGFQLIGKHFREADLFAIGELYESL